MPIVYTKEDIGSIIMVELKPVMIMADIIDDEEPGMTSCTNCICSGTSHCLSPAVRRCSEEKIWFKELQTDFPEFRGNQLVYCHEGNSRGDYRVGLVLDCNYYVGITIAWLGNTEHNMYCMNKKIVCSSKGDNLTQLEWAEDFYYVVECIKNATFTAYTCPNDKPYSAGAQAVCAFV